MPTSQCPDTQQYLAVGCSRSSLISKHFYEEVSSYQNYIQIWMFDLSDMKTNRTPKNHQLICLIPLHNSGAIWSLKWSPACSFPSAYLAAGTSSGIIYLYKIFSQRSTPSNKNVAFYKSSKSIRLSLTEPNHQTQCLAIDWSIHDPSRIAACYSNGVIALFHVNTTAKHLSELVKRKFFFLKSRHHRWIFFRNLLRKNSSIPFDWFEYLRHRFVILNFWIIHPIWSWLLPILPNDFCRNSISFRWKEILFVLVCGISMIVNNRWSILRIVERKVSFVHWRAISYVSKNSHRK